MAEYDYTARVVWTGNRGAGTETYEGYDRSWSVETAGKPIIHGSNDPLLGGDPSEQSPEDMLIAALSACHMLWYLHLASDAGVTVLSYSDDPLVVGEIMTNGASRFLRATLRPLIVLAEGNDEVRADAVHEDVQQMSFIFRSVNFPVDVDARYRIGA